MIDSWLNPRALISSLDLQNIYAYENIASNTWLYPEQVIEHWKSTESFIEIPQKISYAYSTVGRVTPITRAYNLERYLNTDCIILFKREDVLSNSSFKISSAIPQAYYGSLEGKKITVTETGAGQTGVAAALASSLFNLKPIIFMVNSSYEQKPLRRILMQVYGADVCPSPSNNTDYGANLISQGEINGSIAMATTEVYEYIKRTDESMNIAGSLLDFTLTYNSVIGLETKCQLEQGDINPNIIIGCIGGGSSFGGFALPLMYYYDNVEIIAVESKNIPSLTEGIYDYDFPDGEGKSNPLLMYSLGHKFKAPSIHASGLRYHAVSPIVSYFVNKKRITATAIDEEAAIKSAITLAQVESIVVSPESSYTIKAVMDQAKINNGQKKVIIAIITGNGHLDLAAYNLFLDRKV
jgi:tryptophan synthase beta chain